MKELDAAAVRRLLSRWDYAPEAVEAYGRAMERAMRNAGAHEALERAVDGYEAGGDMDIRALLTQMDGFAAPCGESPYTMRMLPYIAMLDGAAARYDSAGIGEKVYHDSFADLLWKTRECHRVYGIWGSFVAPWFYRFFELKCFALGRLQFEFTSFNADGPLESGERVVNVHIPSCGPLKREEYQESYAQATEFFGYAHERETPFVCDSWILHPLCRALPEDSGIRRFAADYELLRVIDDGQCSDMWIIFGRPWDGDAASLPEDTALRRIFKRRLLEGGSVGRGYGLYLRAK